VSPVIPSDILEEAVPGSIRKAEHFIAFMKKIVVYLKSHISKMESVDSKTPLKFLHDLQVSPLISILFSL
jgi:DNA excision repair protein ERCC-2